MLIPNWPPIASLPPRAVSVMPQPPYPTTCPFQVFFPQPCNLFVTLLPSTNNYLSYHQPTHLLPFLIYFPRPSVLFSLPSFTPPPFPLHPPSHPAFLPPSHFSFLYPPFLFLPYHHHLHLHHHQLFYNPIFPPMHRLALTSDLSPLRYSFFPSNSSSNYSNSPTSSSRYPGTYVLRHWIPFDIWPRIAAHLTSVADQASFQNTCRASYAAIQLLHAPRHRLVCDTFHLSTFDIPHDILHKVLMVHVVPPNADSLILFIDESDSGNGVDLAWLKSGQLHRISLGLTNIPATTVSNISFSPDASRIAFLVTLAHGPVPGDTRDPLHRLRGWDRVRRNGGKIYDIVYDPCDDCTVQIVDLVPDNLRLHTFSHVFVPEYGFDMVWRRHPSGNDELAFAAMLHSAVGAATYLVRWRDFACPSFTNFVFMACIDGASAELLHDKRKAMLSHNSTTCTSRIELANDAQSIYFDTVSKFGILRFDQVEDSRTSRVTRADLPHLPPYFMHHSQPPPLYPSPKCHASPSSPCHHCHRDTPSLHHALGQLNVGDSYNTPNLSAPHCLENTTRLSRVSPDGLYLCSLICTGPTSAILSAPYRYQYLEMRLSSSGQLIYCKQIFHQRHERRNGDLRYFAFPFEKSAEVASQSFTFSANSELVILWDTHLSQQQIVYSYQLPMVLEVRTGRLIQHFPKLSSRTVYEFLQPAPDALTLYGARMCKGKILMDAIDVLSGTVLKTVTITGSVHPPVQFSPHANYLLRHNVLHVVSRGRLDVLWQTTRGAMGCGWKARQRLDEHEAYGDPNDEYDEQLQHIVAPPISTIGG